MTDRRFISSREAADLFGLPEKTLSTWRSRPPVGGGPPFLKVGCRVLYAVDRFDAWMREREINNTAQAPTEVMHRYLTRAKSVKQ